MDEVKAERPNEYRSRLLAGELIPTVILFATLLKGITENNDFGPGYLPVLLIILAGLCLAWVPLIAMAGHVVLDNEGVRVTSFAGFSMFVPWSDIRCVGIYRGRPFWGTNELVKIVAPGMSRLLFLFPLNEHMTNFDLLKGRFRAESSAGPTHSRIL